jgi:UDP-glucose 4-epimerase
MKVVVTGGAGFIGSHLVDRLRGLGHEVRVVDCATGPCLQAVSVPPEADVIFHLASPVGPVGVLSWAGRLVREVVQTAAIVGDWAFVNGCPLVNVSTSEVYGSGGTDAEDDACRFGPENTARKEYAVAKLAAEVMLHNDPRLDVRTVRPFNVAGPGQKSGGGFVLPRFVRQALLDQPLTVYGSGAQRRAFTHVADIVDGLIATALRGQPGEVYNLGNARNECSILELATEVDRYVNGERIVPNLIHVDPVDLWGPGFREAPDKVPDAAKAMLELDWHPRRTRATVIAEVVESERLVMAA